MAYRRITDRTPSEDGFRMPGEFEKHKGTLLIWPVRPGSWPYGGRDAKPVFARIARELAAHEEVWILADREHRQEAEDAFAGGRCPEDLRQQIHVLEIPTDDAWARDIGPTFVTTPGSYYHGGMRRTAGISWRFNAWGGETDGLYASWEQDDLAAERFLQALDTPCYDAGDFVLEGGSVHSDGQGTLIVTEECLLSRGRNPQMTKREIEQKLSDYLGAEAVIWLPYGIYNDETNGHVDNICCFAAPGEVILAWTDDRDDPQYARSVADICELEKARDAEGRRLKIHKLPLPAVPVTVREEDLAGYVFEPGEDVREAGERLAASYVNFYIANGTVLVPQFGGANEASDREAVRILEEIFGPKPDAPGRRVVPVEAGAIIAGGGNIHCITQQIY